jgi:hypothetical protein
LYRDAEEAIGFMFGAVHKDKDGVAAAAVFAVGLALFHSAVLFCILKRKQPVWPTYKHSGTRRWSDNLTPRRWRRRSSNSTGARWRSTSTGCTANTAGLYKLTP